MEIRITGQRLSVTEGIKEWVFRKVSKLEKFAPRLVEAHVIIKKEKYLYVAELTLLGPHLRFYSEGENKENLYTAIDFACERMIKQLKKYRERIKDHHLLQDPSQMSKPTQEGTPE